MLSGSVARVMTLLLSFISRTLFIKYLGDACLGVNGVFLSVFQMLSLAELGIGEAITFYLYKPVAENDRGKIASLIRFYRMCYRIIGAVILLLGICLMPFIQNIINLENDIPYNLQVLFVLYLLNTAIPYLFFSYPQTVLVAHQKQYIISTTNAIFSIVQFLFDVMSLVLLRNFLAYLIMRLCVAILQNIVLMVIALRRYPYIRDNNAEKIDKSTLKVMLSDVYSIFVVRTAAQLFTSTDNIIISVILGTELVGINSNYVMITTAMMGFISTFIYACSASVGNLYATESKEKTEQLYNTIDYITFCISFFSAVCFFTLVNPLIELVWGASFKLSTYSVLLISSNFYIPISLYALFCFRQSMGLFKAYRYNQLFAAIVNITLDFILGKWLGIDGIFIATTVANLALTIVPFIKNLYETGFNADYKQYAMKWFIRYFCTMAVCFLFSYVAKLFNGSLISFCMITLIAVFVSAALLWVTTFRTEEYRNALIYLKRVMHKA